MKTKWAKHGRLAVHDNPFSSFKEPSPDALELLYSMAYNHLQRKGYTDAVSFFKLLTTFNPGEQSYWIGLGMAEQGLQEWRKSIEAYAKAAALGPFSAHVHIKAAECYFALKETTSAQQALTCAEDALKIEPQAGLHEQVRLLRTIWR